MRAMDREEIDMSLFRRHLRTGGREGCHHWRYAVR